MKSAVLSLVLASASFFGLNHLAMATCTDGGLQPGAGSIDPYAPALQDPYYPTAPVAPVVYPKPTRSIGLVNGGVPAAPAARITVVDGAAADRSASTPGAPVGRLTVVNEKPADVAKALVKVEPIPGKAASEPAEKIASETPVVKDASETIDPALKDLVGKWMAVARHGDGELTTVELQLDDHGWATLTVPAADGKPSTMKRRIELEDEELKLTGPDAELTLGKLIEINSKQLVLARADGQITFIRP